MLIFYRFIHLIYDVCRLLSEGVQIFCCGLSLDHELAIDRTGHKQPIEDINLDLVDAVGVRGQAVDQPS